MKLFKQSPSGKSFIHGVLSPGQTLNATALFGSRPHFVSAQAMEPLTLIRVRREDYVNFVGSHPSVALKVMNTLDKLLNSTYERLLDVVGERVEQRVCNVLYMLLVKFGEQLSFTNEEIANMGGMSTETAIRVLAKLKERKVIRGSGRGRITVLVRDELKNLSRGPYYL